MIRSGMSVLYALPRGRTCAPGCTCGRHDPEANRKSGSKWRGKTIPAETRKRMSEAHYAKGSCKPGCECGKHSESCRRQISDANLRMRGEGRFRSRETKPEKQIEKLLSDADIEYVKQFRIFKYSVDFYLPAWNLVIEVNGCWWHRCKECGFKDDVRARFKDARRARSIRSRGYELVVVWEHELEGLGV